MSTKVDQAEINNILWQACDTFRGILNATDYKNYILIMLFVKYISDTWEEHYKELEKEYGDDSERIKRRLRDKDQFNNALEEGIKLANNPLLFEVFKVDSRIVREWHSCEVPIFFDFGEEERVWWLLPFKNDVSAYVVPFSRREFIDFNLGKKENSFMDFLKICLKKYNNFFIQKENRSPIRVSIPIPTIQRRYNRRSFRL